MKRIPLRRRDGTVRAYAMVDDADHAWLSQWRWHVAQKPNTLYASRSEHVKWDNHRRKQTVRTFKMHAAIMGAPADHIDGNGLNNQRSNLRLATQAQNGQNRARNVDNTSGERGVTRASLNRWQARAQVAGVMHYLGVYSTVAEAADVVRAFRAEHMPFVNEERS